MGYQRLSFEEREQIALGRAAGERAGHIAQRLGRARSTVSRELSRHTHAAYGYRALWAQRRSIKQSKRPKMRKLDRHAQLCAMVRTRLQKRWSPAQISASLKQMSQAPERNVSAETIYQSLYVQGRGVFRKELHTALRRGRAKRRAQCATKPSKLRHMVMISERPAQAEDRAVPGHWEGDLIIGKGQKSQVATLVERRSRYLILVHLPHDRQAHTVASAIRRRMAFLPQQLRRTLTWDQGREMALHPWLARTTGLQIYFCDPHSPWQRGTSENTNGLLRQYMPKGTDLSVFSQRDLSRIARELNTRPRKTLDWSTPAQYFRDRVALAA